MAIDYRESLEKLNELLSKSQGHAIDVELIIETLISENIDEELKSLVKLALESNEDHITMIKQKLHSLITEIIDIK